MGNHKVLDAKWWTPPLPGLTIVGAAVLADALPQIVIGAVAIESYKDGSWKVYMGYGGGKDEDRDCQAIAGYGMPIGGKEAACGLFPQFDPEKFRF